MDTNSLLASLDENTLILTANERLAAYLRDYYNEQQLRQNRQCWKNKEIISLQTWLTQILQQDLQNPFTIINDYQEFTLWKSIILEEQNFYWPNQLSQLIKQIQETWHLLKEWDISLEQLKDYQQNNVHVFYSWAKIFTKRCSDNQWVDRSSLIPLLIKNIREHKIKLPQKILLSGFLQANPQINSLFTSMQQHCELSNFDLYQSPQNIYQLNFQNEDEEISAAAYWAKELLTSSTPLKIACVIPHLHEIRDKVQKIFTEVFSPKNSYLINLEQSFFNISGGKKLNEFPIIKFALTILQLDINEVDISTISYLLNSVFLAASETEFDSRALLDQELRQLNETMLPLRFMMVYAKTNKRAPILAKIIFKWLLLIKKRPQQALMSYWCKYFIQLLQGLGWPGQRALNSVEYQLVNRFMQLLTELCSIDLKQTDISYDDALVYLQHYCEIISFQPETNDAPLQILGKLEAVGLNFDYLWVMGLDNERFPGNSSLNAWLPAILQQQLQLPHSTAEAELQFCKTLLQRYLCSAKTIFLSYAQIKKDQECQPSSLISKFPNLELPSHFKKGESFLETIIKQAPEYHYFVDNKANTLDIEETTRGGSYLLKDQSHCPFRAFAKFRLHAEPVAIPQLGLNAQERGNLVHEVLMRFWQKIKNHQTLCQQDEYHLQKIISQSIDDSFLGVIKQRPYTFKKRYMAIEKKRLLALLKKWLDIEKNRPPFTVIAQEQQRECQLKNLKLILRIDRIDQLADNSQLLIDYKTGSASISDWLDQRLGDPQLPLYCVTSPAVVQGILFAQIKPPEMAFKGIATENTSIKGVASPNEFNASWPKLLQQWRENLEKLADEYYQGNAVVDPKDGEITCQYCELQALCRINEKELS